MKRRAGVPNTKLLKRTKAGGWRAKVEKAGSYKHSKKKK